MGNSVKLVIPQTWQGWMLLLQHEKVLLIAPRVANYLLLILLASALAEITWRLIPVDERVAPVSSVNGQVNQQRVAISSVSLSTLHLFGEVDKTAPVVQQTVVAPETNLKLTLRGVLASSSPATARAIIGDASNNEKLYSVGDDLPGGARLKEVYNDRVILERAGRLETLRLPKESVAQASPSAQNQRGRPSSSSSRSSVSGSSASREISKKLGEYRETLKTEPQKLMGLVQASPVNKNGQFEGFKIRPGTDRKLFHNMGLRSGDVVKAINGITLDNPMKGFEIMNQLSTADSIALEISRNGQRRSFSFNLNN